jgi:K+-sensing histidine kinase KdpD
MSSVATQSPPGNITHDVPWNDVVLFVRQLSHDLRNHLNAIELQSTFLSELAEDAELKTEVRRLREMIYEIGSALQKLTGSMGQSTPQLMTYRAADFVDDLREKIVAERPKESACIDWKVQLSDENLQIDPQLMQEAILELFTNAFYHDRAEGNLTVHAGVEGDSFVFELREPKKSFATLTEKWGRQPLLKVGHGHYGLGLHRVRTIVENHQGQLQARYVSATSSLHTRITLPLLRNLA